MLQPTMMTLSRYFFWQAVRPTLAALVIILGVVWLLQSLRFLDLIINKGLGLWTFLQLAVLLVPMLLTMIVPLGVFAGCCYALRRWQDDNEITAVLASGQGPVMLWPLLAWSLVACAFGYWLYLDGLPRSSRAFKDLQYNVRNQEGQLLLEEGTFNQLGDDMMIYLKKRVTPTSLEMILVHDTREPAKPVTWYARSAEVTVGADGYPQLLLKNGLRQEIGGKQVSMLEFTSYNLDVRQRLGMKALEPRARNKEEYLLPELLNLAETSTDARERGKLLAEAHKRLLWPLTPLPMVAIAAGWLLRPARRQVSSLRLTVAAGVCAILYVAALMALGSMAESGNPAILWGQCALPMVAIVASGVLGWWANRGGLIAGESVRHG